jgi:hypothetical protein
MGSGEDESMSGEKREGCEMRKEGEDERCWDWLRKREGDRKNGGFGWILVKDVLECDKDQFYWLLGVARLKMQVERCQPIVCINQQTLHVGQLIH